MPESGTYRIVSRYLKDGEGWKTDETELVDTTYAAAGRAASKEAHRLDEIHGDSHFWTVDLHSTAHPEYGSYYQLFHGRLS